MEKQSVARRREPSWRVAATNGLMNLMEAPRYRVAGEPRWRITEVKERKRKMPDVERERCKSTSPSSTYSALLILSSVGERRKQRTVRRRNKEAKRQWKDSEWKKRGKKIVDFLDYRARWSRCINRA